MAFLMDMMHNILVEALKTHGSLFAVLKYPQCSDIYYGGGEPSLEQIVSGTAEDARNYVLEFLSDHLNAGEQIHELKEDDMLSFIVTEEDQEPILFFGRWQREHFCIVEMSPEDIAYQIGL